MAKNLVIITTIGKHGKIFDNIEYIYKNNQGDYKIALAYNGPLDNAVFFNKMGKRFPGVEVVKSNTAANIPLAINNVLIRHNEAEYIFILDDDLIIFEKDWIEKATCIMARHRNKGVLGRAEDKYIDREKQSLGYIDEEHKIKICAWAPTIMCTRRDILAGCGFDPKFYLGHYDIDWQTSVRGKGCIIANYRIKYIHIGGLSTTWLFMNNKKALKEWIYEKERIELYLKKHKGLLSKEYIEKEAARVNAPVKEKFLLWDFIKNQVKGVVISWFKIRLYKLKYG